MTHFHPPYYDLPYYDARTGETRTASLSGDLQLHANELLSRGHFCSTADGLTRVWLYFSDDHRPVVRVCRPVFVAEDKGWRALIQRALLETRP